MTKEYNVLIVGFGIVGKRLSKELWRLHPDIYDKYYPEFNSKRDIRYDIAFICVDTPLTDNNELDITEVEVAIRENDADIYVIKSTLPINNSITMYPRKEVIVYSPEYYGDTQHSMVDFNFTVLAGFRPECIKVQQILQECYDASHQFRIVPINVAEMAKLMENAWLAAKVSFCNQMYNICKKCGVNYEDVREVFILDPRVNPSHTFVYDDHPYWDTHCLNKDVPYLAYSQDAELLQSVCTFNARQKEWANHQVEGPQPEEAQPIPSIRYLGALDMSTGTLNIVRDNENGELSAEDIELLTKDHSFKPEKDN